MDSRLDLRCQLDDPYKRCRLDRPSIPRNLLPKHAHLANSNHPQHAPPKTRSPTTTNTVSFSDAVSFSHSRWGGHPSLLCRSSRKCFVDRFPSTDQRNQHDQPRGRWSCTAEMDPALAQVAEADQHWSGGRGPNCSAQKSPEATSCDGLSSETTRH